MQQWRDFKQIETVLSILTRLSITRNSRLLWNKIQEHTEAQIFTEWVYRRCLRVVNYLIAICSRCCWIVEIQGWNGSLSSLWQIDHSKKNTRNSAFPASCIVYRFGVHSVCFTEHFNLVSFTHPVTTLHLATSPLPNQKQRFVHPKILKLIASSYS